MSRRKKNSSAIQMTPVEKAEGERKENLYEFKRSELYSYAKALVDTTIKTNNNRNLRMLGDFPSDVKDPLFLDKTRQLISNGVIFKPIYRVPDEDLEFISHASILIGAINQLFVDNVKLYSKPNKTQGYGFKFKDADKVPEENDLELFNQYERLVYLMRGDSCKDNSIDRYPAVLEMATRDYLNFDTVAYLITRNRKGEIHSLEYLDPKSIKRVDKKRGFNQDKNIEFVQTDVANNVVEIFEKNRIVYKHKNNLSGLYHRYFGWSPLENCITEIMGQLYAARRNNEKFNVRTVPKKMLTSSARVSPEEREMIERVWEDAFYGAAMGSSVRIPMLFGMQDIQVHDLDWKTEDFYDSFMQWVSSMVLARYGVDAAMLGLNFNKSQSLSEASMDGRQKSSRDRIIGAMMSAHASDMNDILDPDYSEEYEFTYHGVVEDDQSKLADLQKKQIGVSKTMDEIRAQNDDPSWEDLARQYFPDDEKKIKKLSLFGLMVSDPQLTPKLSEILFDDGEEEGEEEGTDSGELDDSDLDELYNDNIGIEETNEQETEEN